MNAITTVPKIVVARECRFAIHMPSHSYDEDDLHLVKEKLHYNDGTSESIVRYIKNYKRPFWVTKKGYQNHLQKKEWASIDSVDEFKSTQSDLRNNVAKALGKSWSRDHLKLLAVSPYLYGCDMTAATLIKHQYITKYPNTVSQYTVAAFDVETDVLYGTGEIIMATITMGSRVFTAVKKSFLTGINEAERRVEDAMHKYLAHYVEKRHLVCELEVVDDEIDIVKRCFETAHKWKPDFLAIWNIDFDIQQVIAACVRAGIDTKDIMCDPSVPPERRFFKYMQGQKKRVTASGKFVPINPAAQWHWVHCPASFWFIDSMCSYKHIRTGKQEETSYSLDNILKKTINFGKLSFKAADGYDGLRWHQFMQENYKIEYIVYNRFDCIGMLEHDEKTKDLAATLPSYSEYSEFSKFNSQPKRLADDLYFECLENNHVVGTVGSAPKIAPDDVDTDEIAEEGDIDDDDDDESGEEKETLSLKGWILTLPSHNTELNGLCCIEEDPTIRTNIRAAVYDADAIASYPSDTAVCNVSKETTLREIITIEDVDEHTFRMQNINMLAGPPNAIEYATAMFHLPDPETLLALYLASKNQ
jgi:hypothetical protein